MNLFIGILVERQMKFDEMKAKGKQMALAMGHLEWENACRSCGCQIGWQVMFCDGCQLRLDYPKLFTATPRADENENDN